MTETLKNVRMYPQEQKIVILEGAKSARMLPHQRKKIILDAAINLSIEKGYRNITRAEVATRSGSAQGLIGRYFKTMDNLKHEVLKEAMKHEIMPILIENLSAKELPFTYELKQKVINYLNN